LSLKGFPVVPMGIQRDACSAGLLNDPTRSATKSFSEIPAGHRARSGEAGGSESSSERSERARDKQRPRDFLHELKSEGAFVHKLLNGYIAYLRRRKEGNQCAIELTFTPLNAVAI